MVLIAQRWSKFHTEYPEALGATTKNLVATVIWRQGFVHTWTNRPLISLPLAESFYKISNHSYYRRKYITAMWQCHADIIKSRTGIRFIIEEIFTEKLKHLYRVEARVRKYIRLANNNINHSLLIDALNENSSLNSERYPK